MGATALKTDFSGFVRMITYTKQNGQFKDMTESFEGIIKNGKRKGFGRFVSAEQRTSFIGQMDGDHATYKGLFYKDFDTKYIGVWSDGSEMQNYNTRPNSAFWFDNFGFEPIEAVEPEIDAASGIRTWPDGSQTYADGSEVTDYYADQRDEVNPYLIDEIEEEKWQEENKTPEEEAPSDWSGEEEWTPEEESEWEECAYDDDECWENMEYDWTAGDDDMFADWGDDYADEFNDDWYYDDWYYDEDYGWGDDDEEDAWKPEEESFFDDDTVGQYEYNPDDYANSYNGWDVESAGEEEEMESMGGDSGEESPMPSGEEEEPEDSMPEDSMPEEEESESEEISSNKASVQAQCFGWVAEMLTPPDFYFYGDNSYTWTASDYWLDEYLGGNSVLKAFYLGDYEYAVESPVKEKAYDYKDLLEAKYDAGQKQGGYYVIKNIAKAPAVDGDSYGTYYDVWLLTKPLGQSAHKKLHDENNTMSAKYWDDQAGVSGFKNYINGLARVIKYYRTYADADANVEAENLVLVEILEGEVEKGVAKGFVRKIKSAKSSSFVGDLADEKPIGKGVYFKDYELVHQGKWAGTQDKYTEEPANPMRFTSFDPLDSQEVVDQGALAEERMDKAYASGFAFLAAMGFAPDWRLYGAQNPATKAIRLSYEKPEAGGGPITGDILVDGMPMVTPLAEDFWTFMDHIANAAYDGSEMGGYIKLSGIAMGESTYADVWLYATSGEQGYDFLRSINATDQRTSANPLPWTQIAD